MNKIVTLALILVSETLLASSISIECNGKVGDTPPNDFIEGETVELVLNEAGSTITSYSTLVLFSMFRDGDYEEDLSRRWPGERKAIFTSNQIRMHDKVLGMAEYDLTIDRTTLGLSMSYKLKKELKTKISGTCRVLENKARKI